MLSLEEASARALATHEAIRAAAAERERASVVPWRAYAALGPTVRETGSYTRAKDSIVFPLQGAVPPDFNTTVVAQDVLRGVLSVTQPVYTHQFWALRRLGQAAVAAGDAGYRAVEQDVLLAVAAAYYDVLRAQALSEVAAEAQRLATTEVAHAEARVDAGEAVRSDVLRAQTQQVQAEQRIAESSGEVTVATDRLRRLSGVDGEFEVAEPPSAPVDRTAVEPLIATALTRNPDLGEQEAQLATARAEEQRRAAALLPTLGAHWDYQSLNHETFADLNGFWSLVLAIDVPLIESGGSRYLDLAEQRAVVSRNTAQVAGFRRDLEVDVRRAYVTARTLAAQLTAANKQVELARESYRMLSEQYEAGVATNLDVLSALAVLTEARANQARVRYARAVALEQLQRVTGTLGEAAEVTP